MSGKWSWFLTVGTGGVYYKGRIRQSYCMNSFAGKFDFRQKIEQVPF